MAEIDLMALRNVKDIHALVFDKDNTLTLPYASTLHPSVINTVEYVKKVFADHSCIFSNSIGDAVDASNNYKRAHAYEAHLGLPILRHKHQVAHEFHNFL